MAREASVLVLPELLMRLYCLTNQEQLWHNRRYPSELQVREDGGRISLRRGTNRCDGLPISALWNSVGGGTAHVVASGPSIGEIAARERILNAYTMTVNGSSRLFEGSGMAVDAYLVDDPHFARTRTEELVANARGAKRTFLSYQAVAEVLKRQTLEGIEVVLFDGARRPFRMRTQPEPVVTQPDLSTGVLTSDTVVLVALQLLVCLGFRDIAIFGMDLSMSGRFYAEAAERRQQLDRDFENRIVAPFRTYAEGLKRDGVTVINCSAQSRLSADIFPRVDAGAYLDAHAT